MLNWVYTPVLVHIVLHGSLDAIGGENEAQPPRFV